MFLYKRGAGCLYIAYKDKNGKSKRISTKTKNKSEAVKFLTNFNKEVKKRNEQDTIPITLEALRVKILKKLELTHTEKTINVYKTTLKYFIDYFGSTAVSKITKQNIQAYLDSRIQNTSIYAARKDLINLKGVFRLALEDSHILINPCDGIKQFKIPEKQPLYFSREEYEKLKMTITDIDFQDLVQMAINTGMRQGELIYLNWGQINLEDKLIILDNRKHVTKSKRIRTIPLNETVMEILSRRSLSSAADTVFNYKNQNNVSHIFKKYVLKANLNPHYHMHCLRHSFASWLIQKNISIFLVSKLLGHADIKTTQIYAHLRQDDLFNAVNHL